MSKPFMTPRLTNDKKEKVQAALYSAWCQIASDVDAVNGAPVDNETALECATDTQVLDDPETIAFLDKLFDELSYERAMRYLAQNFKLR